MNQLTTLFEVKAKGEVKVKVKVEVEVEVEVNIEVEANKKLNLIYPGVALSEFYKSRKLSG